MVTHSRLSHGTMNSLSVMSCLALCITRSCCKWKGSQPGQEEGCWHCKWAAKGMAWRWARDKSDWGCDACSKICQKHPVHSRLEIIRSNLFPLLILPFISQPRSSLQNRVSKPPPLVTDDLSACLCCTGMLTQDLHFQWHGSGHGLWRYLHTVLPARKQVSACYKRVAMVLTSALFFIQDGAKTIKCKSSRLSEYLCADS